MPSLCILTDSTAQFIKPGFAGRALVNSIMLRTQMDHRGEDEEFRVSDLPASTHTENAPRLLTPGVEEFRQQFISLGHQYNEIVAILASSHLSSLVENAHEAAISVRGRVSVQIIDSQTTGIGLGYLVQLAAEAASRKAGSNEIDHILHGAIPHIYSVFCIPGLSYLYHSGFIDFAQSSVGEILNLLPLFSLEEGFLTPLEKARNNRQLIDFFQEFLDEFSDLIQISIIQSVPGLAHESRILREHALSNFPGVPFSEHPIGLSLATMFGPRCMGVFAIETSESK
jgi:DegV family protein with EDD domain